MAYAASNSTIVTDTKAFTTAVGSGEEFIQWIKDQLVEAGWTRQALLAKISYTAFGIADGDTVTLDGNVFTFYSTTPSGSNPVNRGASNHAAMVNLGAEVLLVMDWDSTVSGDTITFTVASNGPEYTGNVLLCSTTRAGVSGIFDFNPDSTTGLGRTWNGGFRMTSSAVHSNPLIIDFRTIASRTCDITALIKDPIANFTGIQVNNSWSIVANKYQFILYITGIYVAGAFMLASHLKPSRDLEWANFVTGPFNPVSPFGGRRDGDFSDLSVNYYADIATGSPYTDIITTDPNETVTLVYPGFGYGVTSLQKLINKIPNFTLVRDDGTGIPFEAFIAICPTDPGSFATSVQIVGQLWDSLIYATLGVKDNSVDIGGKDGIVMMTQQGSADISIGSLVVQIET